MIIKQRDRKLLEAGTVRFVGADRWGVEMEVIGLGPDGTNAVFTVILAMEEIARLYQRAFIPEDPNPFLKE